MRNQIFNTKHFFHVVYFIKQFKKPFVSNVFQESSNCLPVKATGNTSKRLVLLMNFNKIIGAVGFQIMEELIIAFLQ